MEVFSAMMPTTTDDTVNTCDYSTTKKQKQKKKKVQKLPTTTTTIRHIPHPTLSSFRLCLVVSLQIKSYALVRLAQ
jgi:hypothetical protein